MSPPLVRNWNKVFTWRFVGNMKERHDNASKEVNGAHERRRRRTGQMHGKAFANIFTSRTQAPHINDHGKVHDVSQAVIPRRNQTRQRIHIHTSRAGGSPPVSNPAGARLDSAQPPSSLEPSRAVQRRHTQPPPMPRPLPVSFPAAQLLPRLHMLPLTSTRRLSHGATVASQHHHGRRHQPPWSAGRLHATVTSRGRQPPPSTVAATSRRPSRSGRGGADPGDGARLGAGLERDDNDDAAEVRATASWTRRGPPPTSSRRAFLLDRAVHVHPPRAHP
uniref:Uncharacterized protein n=1 Tax=Oryza nivara TaxID=4536 RepID=A0A0E0IAQ7_ORYNI